MLGVPELLIIGAIVVLVFGASRLPAVGDGIGRAIRNFKRDVDTKKEIPAEKGDPPVSEKKAG